MAWDTARTKRLLLEAAVEEFAEHGPLGARVDRVASAAKVNKERIYQYFGGKEQLFTAVLESELAKAAEAVPLPAPGDGSRDGTGDSSADAPGDSSADTPAPGDLGDFAGRLYDYHSAHPHLLRLLAWEGLRDGRAPVVAEAERAAHYADKAARIATLQLDGTVNADFEPGRLFGAAFALATWWLTMPQLARMALSGADGSPETTRDALVRMVRALTAPAARAR